MGKSRARWRDLSLSDFHIVAELFRSPAGTVYKAVHKASRELCVLKERRSAELGKRHDIMHEVRLMEQLEPHPNVVQCRGHFWDSGGSLFMVLEFADAGDLYGEIVRRRERGQYYTEDEVWDTFLQLCRGLNHLHEAGIIHRDIKALNVFRCSDGSVKLGDLGVSRQVSQDTLLLHSFYGTPLYASPELCNNQPYNERTDMWSLGVLLYELAALRPPFGGSNLLALADAIRRGHYDPLPEQYSHTLARMCGLLLQQDFADRPCIHDVLSWFDAARQESEGDDDEGEMSVDSLDGPEVEPEREREPQRQPEPQPDPDPDPEPQPRVDKADRRRLENALRRKRLHLSKLLQALRLNPADEEAQAQVELVQGDISALQHALGAAPRPPRVDGAPPGEPAPHRDRHEAARSPERAAHDDQPQRGRRRPATAGGNAGLNARDRRLNQRLQERRERQAALLRAQAAAATPAARQPRARPRTAAPARQQRSPPKAVAPEEAFEDRFGISGLLEAYRRLGAAPAPAPEPEPEPVQLRTSDSEIARRRAAEEAERARREAQDAQRERERAEARERRRREEEEGAIREHAARQAQKAQQQRPPPPPVGSAVAMARASRAAHHEKRDQLRADRRRASEARRQGAQPVRDRKPAAVAAAADRTKRRADPKAAPARSRKYNVIAGGWV